MNAETRKILERAEKRLSGQKDKTPQPVDAWERLSEQLMVEAWKRTHKETTCNQQNQ